MERLIKDGDLQEVTPDAQLTDRLMLEAGSHLDTAATAVTHDSAGAYQLAYDGARKACTALLEHQGLRPTEKGGHLAVQDAMAAQFDGPGHPEPFGGFGRFRQRRRTAQYPGPTDAPIAEADAEEGLRAAKAILEGAREILAAGALTVFRADSRSSS